jgi:tape measure domain-containing protein
MARSSTFTSYVRSELDPRTGTAYRQLETIANRTYDSIARRAAAASTASAQLAAGGTGGGGAAATKMARVLDATAAAQTRAAKAANDNSSAQRLHGTALREAATASIGLERNLSTLATTLNVVQGPLGPLAGRVRSVSAAMTELTGLRFGVAAVGASLFVFGRLASEFTNVQNRLRPLFDTQQQFNQAFGDVVGIANRSRQALAPLAELYSRITIGGRDIGLSQARIGRVTEIAAKAATLSGGSADIQQRGIVQFSQGLGRGVLQGQDLKAVLEDIPILGKAIAAGFKNADGSIGTTIGHLRDLGSEGKLTGLAIADALERADQKVVETPFAKLPITIAAGISRVENSFGQVIGRINDATGATDKLGGSLVFIADHLRTLIALASGLAGAFVAPKVLSYLTSIVTRIDDAAERSARLSAVVAGTGNVTPINAPAPVRALGLARNAADDANAANQEAQVAVAATRAKIAALEEEGVAYRQGIAAARQQLAAAEQAAAEQVVGANAATDAILAEAAATRQSVAEIQEAAAADRAATAQRVADTEARVAALRVEAEQITASQALIDKQAASAASAKATRASLNAQGMSYVGVGAADQAALDSSVSTGRAQVLMRQQQTAATAELAAAERDLSSARLQDAAAADREAAAAAAVSVSQGSEDVVRQSTILTTYRQRERAVTAELGEINVLLSEQYGVANAAAVRATAATEAVSVAQRAATVATSLFGGALNILKASIPFLVISALVTAVTYLASAESQAAQGARELADAQTTMGKFIDTTTGKIKEQNKALVQGELIKTRGSVATSRSAFQTARDDFRAAGASIMRVRGAGGIGDQTISTGLPENISRLVNAVADNVRGSAAQLDAALTVYARTSTTAAGQVDAIRTKQAAAVTALRQANSFEAYGQTLEGKGTPGLARIAGGDFNRPGTPEKIEKPGLSAAQLKANADQVAANNDLQRAIAAREKVIADGAAAREAGTFDEKAYGDQLTQATIAVNQAREAQKALNAARRDGAKAATQAKRNEGDVARDAAQQARDAAERALQGKQQDLEGQRPTISRQQYIDQRIANLKEYDDSINKTNKTLADQLTAINGNRSASGKQAVESHKAADQQVADAKDVGAARRELTTAFERSVAASELRLQGHDNEAAALGQTLTEVEKIGDAGYGFYQTLLAQNRVEELLNAKLAERERITSTLQASVNNVRESLTSFLVDVQSNAPQAVAGLGKNLLSGFQKGMASIAADNLLSGADQRIKDLISGKSAVQSATDFAAVQFSRTGTAAANLAGAFETARNFVLRLVGQTPGAGSSTTSPAVTTTGVPSSPSALDTSVLSTGSSIKALLDPNASTAGIMAAVAGLGGAAKMLAQSTSDLADGAGIATAVTTGLEKLPALSAPLAANDNASISGAADAGANDNEVVVTGRRIAPAIQEPILNVGGPVLPALLALTNSQAKSAAKMPTLREVYNETGKSIGDRLDSIIGTKFLGKVGDKLGDALGGAGKGSLASSLASAVGLKGQSQTGAAIGGAVGGVLDSFKSVSKALGPFGEALAPVLGIVGGLVGGLFTKVKYGTASVSLNSSGEAVGGTGSGYGSAQVSAATGAAKSVASGINQIISQLGASVSNLPGVTIGSFNGKARVALTNTSQSLNYNNFNHSNLIDFGEGGDQDAIEYAVRYSITHAVVSGISQASKNIIASGQDLETAITKAVAIENIPKQLLQLTDPVKYAVTTLNDQFSKLISYLNEGGATASQYADAQKLYDLQRTAAIKQATADTTKAIDDFLASMTASTSSPLNKRTAYDNATAALSNFQTDINAGKVVDQNDLLTAAKNFQDTSRALNGSSSSFFDDFDMLQTLLTKARDNAQGAVGTDTAATLPVSPFTTDTTAAAALATLNSSTKNQTDVLSQKLDNIADVIRASGGGTSTATSTSGSSVGLLPGFAAKSIYAVG